MLPHEFWQELHAPGSFDRSGPFSGFYRRSWMTGGSCASPFVHFPMGVMRWLR